MRIPFRQHQLSGTFLNGPILGFCDRGVSSLSDVLSVFLQRKWAMLSLNQDLQVAPHHFDPKRDYLANIVLEADFLQKKR